MDSSSLRSIISSLRLRRPSAAMMRLVLPPLLLLTLAILTLLFDLITPPDTPTKLVAESMVWPILFLATTILVPFQIWQQKLETLSFDHFQWIEKNEANVAICFLLAHVCSAAAGSGHCLWLNIFLPAAVASIKVLSSVPSEHTSAPRAMVITCLVTVLSLHTAMMLYNPSIMMIILGVCKAVFLAKGLLLCETLGGNSLPKYEELSSNGRRSAFLLFPFPQHTIFLVRLRTIAFLLTVMLTASLVPLCRLNLLETTLTVDWWKCEVAIIGIECGRWFLICFLLMEQHYDSSVLAITLAVSSLLQLIYQFPTRYFLAAEMIITIILLCSNLITVDLSSIHTHRITFIFLVILCVMIAFMSIRQISAPTQPTMSDHPIEELIRTSRAQFSETLARQSRTLEQAVHEYKARTGMDPPPKFDQWYAFAKSNNVQMIDEYDIIRDLIRPFWGVPPATIRQNVRDELGAENNYFERIFIRNGQGNHALLDNCAHHLPDMDLLFNGMDEPSVVIPHDMLDRLVATALKDHRHSKIHHFSERPSDIVDNIPTHYPTNILNLAREMVWNMIIQSCPLDSPVREINGTDLATSYARFPLGFIYNITAFANVCNQPSLRYHHGFFDCPSNLHYSSTLLPVFSVTKVSSFNDILYPNLGYYHRLPDESRDMDWELKQDRLHWRGSNTGGYNTLGGWSRHHRQRLVMAMDNITKPVNILRKVDNAWIEDVMSSAAAQTLFDVKFTALLDSTAEAREAQEREFEIAPWEDFQDLWKWRFLLDVDGHAHSGRYYAMLRSKSLVFKCTMFREWHDEWLWPWVHYVPLGLNGSDWFETVRFFAHEETGRLEGKRIADESREWSNRTLRREDMETWMFRLLLEYARVIDDRRETLGFEL